MKTLTVQQPLGAAYSRRMQDDGEPLVAHALSRTTGNSCGVGIDSEACRRYGHDAYSLPRGQVVCILEIYDCKKQTAQGRFRRVVG